MRPEATLKGRRVYLFKGVVALSLLPWVAPSLSRHQIRTDGDVNEPTVGSDAGLDERGDDVEATFGLDVSWPCHRRVSNNYAWLPHNVDPEHHAMPNRYRDVPVQPLGDRHAAYVEHLEGCRSFYGLAANQCDVYDYDRILMNLRQPQSMQNYTDVGFKKIRAPERVVELIKDFWEKNQFHQKQEEWPLGNIYTNHWRAPTYMVSVDNNGLRGGGPALKRNLWDAARRTIEDWTGEELSPTSMYGIRVYTDGAVVVPHVDRLPLVASAMINVAQEVDEEWPLELYDHEGRAHNLTMSPGDMVLFESHSVLHGRPFPLKGRYYAMMFIHFEPIGHSLHYHEGSDGDVDEQYKKATDQGLGGPSAADQGHLPPYIKRESPEEEHWLMLHPEGWRAPASIPVPEESASAPEAHRAAGTGDVKKLAAAISKAPERKDVVDKRDSKGFQPIHEGAASGHREVVELLVDNGADVNTRTHGGRGGTPLYLALQRFGSDHRIVRYLKSLGALNIPPDKSEL